MVFMDIKKKQLAHPKNAYQIKITLLDIEPPIWRRLVVPCNITFHKFHKILQVAMGWCDYHLYSFTIGGVHYGIPDPESEFDCQDSRWIKLEQVLMEKLEFTYVYDFGDNWEHKIRVEAMFPVEEWKRFTLCLYGERSCPPEDVGGTLGYCDFLEAIFNPRHPEHGRYLSWAGGEFDPEHFDIEAVNNELKKLGRGGSSQKG